MSITKNYSAPSRKGLYFTGALILVIGGFLAFAINDRREDLKHFYIEQLEKRLIEDKKRLSNYEDVREYVRAYREGRRPNLTADQFDSAKVTAEELAKRYDLKIDFGASR